MRPIMDRLYNFFRQYRYYYIFIVLFVVIHPLFIYLLNLYMDFEISNSRTIIEREIDDIFTIDKNSVTSIGIQNKKFCQNLVFKKYIDDKDNNVPLDEEDGFLFARDYIVNDTTSWYALIYERKQKDYIEASRIIPFELRLKNLKDSTILTPFILHKLLDKYHIDSLLHKYAFLDLLYCCSLDAPYHKMDTSYINNMYFSETHHVRDLDLSVSLDYKIQPLIAFYISEDNFMVNLHYSLMNYYGTILEVIILVVILFLFSRRKRTKLKQH